tara:strand:+ start:5962 stop:6153 length:192 start_codon:yes stop_codon:yes gene_type:complete
MSDKKFYKLIIGLLKSIDENTRIYKEDDTVYIESDENIAMTKEVYEQICEELGENDLTFMGIS